jgi:excisionase family DNA binding protein
MPEDIASDAELAQVLGISEVAIFKRIKRGTVDATKVGRKWRVRGVLWRDVVPK